MKNNMKKQKFNLVFSTLLLAGSFTAVGHAAARTIQVVNNCTYPVWMGVSGGAVQGASSSSCPKGATASGGSCYWDNTPGGTASKLQITGGNPDNNFELTPGKYNTDSITFNDFDNESGVIWNGGITARLGCSPSDPDGVNGGCLVAGCNPKTDISPGAGKGRACTLAHSFGAPNDQVEFALLGNGVDTYDVTLINGMTVPMSMGPTTSPSSVQTSPYHCGIAGSVEGATSAAQAAHVDKY